MEQLTKRQQTVFEFICTHQADTGFPPTRVEISKAMGFSSPNAAEEHLKALHRKGAIEVLPGTSRGIKILLDVKGIPIVGQVAAGEPILAEQNIESHIEVPANFFRPKADFLLRVKGTSMKNIGIMDGDLLAVKNAQTAETGQIVVARIDDEVTVKRLRKLKTKIQLIAENEDFPPIDINPKKDNFAIEGLAVGVIRPELNQ